MPIATAALYLLPVMMPREKNELEIIKIYVLSGFAALTSYEKASYCCYASNESPYSTVCFFGFPGFVILE